MLKEVFVTPWGQDKPDTVNPAYIGYADIVLFHLFLKMKSLKIGTGKLPKKNTAPYHQMPFVFRFTVPLVRYDMSTYFLHLGPYFRFFFFLICAYAYAIIFIFENRYLLQRSDST